jgi:dipeptidyl aminopeptidase/acylaminoacyl peptidase
MGLTDLGRTTEDFMVVKAVCRVVAALAAAASFGGSAKAVDTSTPPDLKGFLGYPYESNLAAAPHGGAIAWVETIRGVRNIWVARGPLFAPRRLTNAVADDGQELMNLTFAADGRTLVWTRGGDHDANWPASGGLEPDPVASPVQPHVEIWAAPTDGAGSPVRLAEGDFPAVSAKGVVAFIRDKQVWSVPLDGKGKAGRLVFDRGEPDKLTWSPNGGALAFVSKRGDHAFIAIFRDAQTPLTFLAPSTGIDANPQWSRDGRRLAFTRRQGMGGAPPPILTEIPHPWSIWVADAASGSGAPVWRSGPGLADSMPGDPDLMWMAGDRLVFMSEADGWQQLYSVSADGGVPIRLTNGAFMVEHLAASPDGARIVYDANTGDARDDIERRHLFAVSPGGGTPVPLTSGEGLEYEPVFADDDDVAFVAAGAKAPTTVALVTHAHQGRRLLATGGAAEFPAERLVTPRAVTFEAPDGLTIHADLFEAAGGAGRKPAVIFVHGGPPRQMLLGWSYMDYYSNAYAVNEYLATHGFAVLSVNYRLGIGYGRAFNHAEHAGYRGAAEYQDVLAGARWLQARAEVDPARIGIWGGSYGGYLTAMALARNSDVFKAGVDLHGVHDWTQEHSGFFFHPGDTRYEKGDVDKAREVAWTSSPVADIARWRSPVLLIQGDDDRNVDFHQTVDLARRLEAVRAPYEELVLPNEIHGFLRYASWLEADSATVDFLNAQLKPGS